MTILFALFVPLTPPAVAKTALTRVAVCEALLRRTDGGTSPSEAPRRALNLIGRRAVVIDPAAAHFDVDTTLDRTRRLADGVSDRSAALARLGAIEDGGAVGREVVGAAAIRTELDLLLDRATATDALVTDELARLYPPDRAPRRWLRWAGALALIPPAALAVSGAPEAAVTAVPLTLTPPAALYALYRWFGRDAALTSGLGRHVERIRRSLDAGRPDVVMFSGSIQVPYRLSHALTDRSEPTADALRDMAIVSEDGVRLPFEASRAPKDVEMRQVFYDSIFVMDDEPRWAIVIRVVTQGNAVAVIKTPTPAGRRE